MALPTVAAGAVKAATAKNMAKAFTMMNKTDWEGVNNAMVSMKDFAESASLVQETLSDIKDQAQGLIDIALGTAMSQLALAFGVVFDLLEPLATGIDKLVVAMEAWGVKIFDVKGQIITDTTEADQQAQDFKDWWKNFWETIFPPDVPTPIRTPGLGKIIDLEGGGY